MANRKMSVVPSERRKSIAERKLSIESRGDAPASLGRRPSMDFRRMSIADGRKHSMAGSLRAGLMSADRNRMANVKYENTYKTEPDDKFPIYEARKIANSVLTSFLEDKEYNKDDCQRLTIAISDRIKQQVRALGQARFKIVAIVSIGQQQETHPSMTLTSRCIWNDKLDNFAEVTFANRHLYAVALVYALYAD